MQLFSFLGVIQVNNPFKTLQGGLQGGYKDYNMDKKNKKNKAIVRVFETYCGVELVIANKYATLKDLSNYVYSDGDPLEKDDESFDASTTKVMNKTTKRKAILVRLNDISCPKGTSKLSRTVQISVHEATHVVLMLYQHMGENISLDYQEPTCYLIDDIAQKIFETFTAK